MVRKNITSKKWWKAAGVRALRTLGQTLGGTIPVGLVITPTMVQNASWTYLYVILAWLATGVISAIGSLCTSLKGLPEVDDID